VGISRDYPLKTRTSKQPIGKVPGYEIIPSHPLKYPRSKQGLRAEQSDGFVWSGEFPNRPIYVLYCFYFDANRWLYLIFRLIGAKICEKIIKGYMYR
jgi:hypothetical protein